MGEDQKGDPMEILSKWLVARVVSSFKCKPEQADAMAAAEASIGAINQFFGDEECQRLLVYAAPDLTAVRTRPRTSTPTHDTPNLGVRRRCAGLRDFSPPPPLEQLK